MRKLLNISELSQLGSIASGICSGFCYTASRLMLPDGADDRALISPRLRDLLRHILMSGTFTAQEGKLLTALVDHYLQGNLDQQDNKALAHEIGTIPSQLRRVGTHVREKMPAYYATAGLSQTIRIDFPERGYKIRVREVRPLAALTPDDRAFFVKALDLRDTRVAEKLTQAIRIIEDLATRNPTFAPAFAVLAETYALRPLHAVQPLPYLRKALEFADTALRLDPKLWTAHAAKSIVSTFLWNWSDAEASLESARYLHARANLHPACFAFLAAKRRFPELISLVDSELQEMHFEAMPLLLKGNLCLGLMLAGEYDRAETLLKDTSKPHPITTSSIPSSHTSTPPEAFILKRLRKSSTSPSSPAALFSRPDSSSIAWPNPAPVKKPNTDFRRLKTTRPPIMSHGTNSPSRTPDSAMTTPR
jgi:tetratricopeptide (TPR) repeat protein